MATQKLDIYKLHFTSPIHFGDLRDDYGVSLKTIPSDTFYAALISCLAKLGKGKRFADNGDLGCTISSLFPFYQADKTSEHVLFFPKPLSLHPADDKHAVANRKRIRNVTWMDTTYFSKVLCGEPVFDENTIKNAIKGEYLTDRPIDKDFIKSSVTSRSAISRTGEVNAEFFYMDRIAFEGCSGLFFIVDGNTELLDEALALLQHEGVGTDRNIGNGCFEYDKTSVEIDVPDNSDFALSLSSFVPESKEELLSFLDDDRVAYDFQRRGGWITTHPFNEFRKDVVYAFTAASVFRWKNCERLSTKGKVSIDLQPGIMKGMNEAHPIWRCGRALFVPIKLN